MSSATRLFWGSLLGALAVLSFHPASNPFYKLFFAQLGPSEVLSHSTLLIDNVKRVSPPKTKREASFYLIIAARKLMGSSNLSSQEALYASAIAAQCAQDDPENAFWAQMGATFGRLAGQKDLSQRLWARAASATRWDDGQNARLIELSKLLVAEYGNPMGWQTATLIHERSNAHAIAIASGARGSRPLLVSDIQPRIDSLFNGQLILEGGRSIEIGSAGIRIMQDACFPADKVISGSYAERLRQRQRLIDEIRAHNRPADATTAESLFRSADSWSNVVDTPGNREDRVQRQALAVVAASLPGPLLYLALLGLLIYGLSQLLSNYNISHRVFSYPLAPILGLMVGTLVYSFTYLVWPALWGVLSLAFFVFQPSAVRSSPPTGLNAQHRLVLMVVGSILALTFVAFIAGLGAPLRALSGQFSIPVEYQAGSSLLIGLTLLMFSIIVFSAPVWAIITRHDPVQLLQVTLRELGKGLIISGLVASTVVTPFCVWLDRSVSDPLTRTLLNEPNLYLSE